jgi:hypothetical protein
MQKVKIKIADNKTPKKVGRPRKYETEEARHEANCTSKRKHWHNEYGKPDAVKRMEQLEKLVSVKIVRIEEDLTLRVKKLEDDVHKLKWHCYKEEIKK